MSEYPVFKNAPIIEALLDIQVTLPPGTNLATLASIHDDIKDRYPNRQEKSLFQFQFGTENGQPTASAPSQNVHGYLFVTPTQDSPKVLQARMDGFTFSKLKPYDNWKSFKSEADELWRIYVAHTRPVKVQRLGLRNINRFEFPLPFKDLKDFLLTAPDVSTKLEMGLSEFLMRLALPQSDPQTTAVVTMAMEQFQNGNKTVNITFDIDVFKIVDYYAEDEAIWRDLEDLREIRNRIFFGSITPQTEELYQ